MLSFVALRFLRARAQRGRLITTALALGGQGGAGKMPGQGQRGLPPGETVQVGLRQGVAELCRLQDRRGDLWECLSQAGKVPI
mgnify:CR=1 FL=1